MNQLRINTWIKIFCTILLPIYVVSAYAQNSNDQKSIILQIVKQDLTVHGKTVKRFNIVQPDGSVGYTGYEGQDFNVILENRTDTPTGVHWHGLYLPNKEDGVPYVTQLPIPPGGKYAYRFKLYQSGTYWMHSHYKDQEQELLGAPLILLKKHPKYPNAKNVVVMFNDFTFKSPKTVFESLKKPKMVKMDEGQDLYDVDFDAFLANRKTLRNPQIITVKPGEKIRLRLINAAVGSNFFIHLGRLNGKLIATDGEDVQPLYGNNFQLAMANRLDIIVTIPKKEGAYPILVQGEGTTMQTGIILKTANAKVPTIKEHAANNAPGFNIFQFYNVHPIEALPTRPVNRTLKIVLDGDMKTYSWGINNEKWPHIKPFFVKKGERIKMVFINKTGMAHPMHFHGHVFQLVGINGTPVNGYKGDTILVLPHTKLSVIFDAYYPGIWPMHCHLLYHQEAGMMTTINYIGYPPPDYYLKKIGLTKSEYHKLELS